MHARPHAITIASEKEVLGNEERRAMRTMAVTNKKANQRKSMLGTGLFVIGFVAAVVSVVTGSSWMAGIAVPFLIVGVAMLCQVGRSLR